jgi:hypothetical protein
MRGEKFKTQKKKGDHPVPVASFPSSKAFGPGRQDRPTADLLAFRSTSGRGFRKKTRFFESPSTVDESESDVVPDPLGPSVFKATEPSDMHGYESSRHEQDPLVIVI